MKGITFSRQSPQKRQQWICFTVYVIIMLLLLMITGIFSKNKIIFFVMLSITGFISWTYVEYHMHRFWTHNKTSKLTKGAYKSHMHHHQHPTEIKVTQTQRIILFVVSSLLFAVSIRWNNYFTLFTGFFIGFTYSLFSHWMLHQPWSRKFFPQLHRFHIYHHYKYPDRCYGFSSTLWDHIFHTTPPKAAVIAEPVIQFYYGKAGHPANREQIKKLHA